MLSVLVVDQDVDTLKLASEAVRAAGGAARAVTNRQHALDLLGRERFQVILLGFPVACPEAPETLRQIHSRCPNVPIVAATDGDGSTLPVGVRTLSKPFLASELLLGLTAAVATAQAPTVTFNHVTLARSIEDRHAALGWIDGALAAVLVRLDDEAHEDARGLWFLEVGFGPCDSSQPRTFRSLAEAEQWMIEAAIDYRQERTA